MTLWDRTARLLVAGGDIERLEGAEAALFLLGSYDGSGNYGDIAQFLASLELVADEKRFVPVPILESEHFAKHLELLGGNSLLERPVPVYFDPGLGPIPDGLQPMVIPPGTKLVAAYLYGGGFLNSSWGDRKLAHLRSLEGAIAGAGLELGSRISSGLQLDSEWVAVLSPEDAGLITRFGPLGMRDPGSVAAVAAFGEGGPKATLTGDDAAGFLVQWVTASPPPTTEWPPPNGMRVNVHVNENDWVTSEPERLVEFVTGFVACLGKLCRQEVTVRPLIAYEDSRITERPSAGRLAEIGRSRELAFDEPLLLRPSSMIELVPELRRAALTLSCSYHVALTSLMIGVPTVLIAGNEYYRQKGAGLQHDFSLPGDFLLMPGGEPAAAARQVHEQLTDPSNRAALQAAQHSGSLNVVERRRATQDRLRTTLQETFDGRPEPEIASLRHRLQRRSAAAAELMHEVAIMRVEREALQQAAEEKVRQLAQLENTLQQERLHRTASSPPDLNARLAALETTLAHRERAIELMLNSLSWKLTRPLRTLKSIVTAWGRVFSRR